MENPHRGNFDVELAGKKYPIRFGLEGIAALEREIGRANFFSNFGVADLATAVAIGVRQASPMQAMTPARVLRLIEKGKNYGSVMRTVAKALRASYPSAEEIAEDEDAEEANTEAGADAGGTDRP